MPKRIKDRQDRKAAYEETAKQVTKWTPLVKANREAATLRLGADNDIARVTTAAGIASKHEVATDFEREVAELLKAAGHADVQALAQVRLLVLTVGIDALQN